ncbi:MAG: hypothetical protein M3O50_07955 [Myxococcota bacterium]|nr:hypothetical protein [Myxococcota bacterium]
MKRLRILLFLFVCSCGWNPSRPFERDAPMVSRAVADLEAGDAASAANRLEEYLNTGDCKEGNIGTPDSLKRRADGTFDLGLALFRISEQLGRRFGEEESEAPPDQARRAQRHALVECARRVVGAIAESDTAGELRARSQYLDGNSAFLDGDYRAAVRAYDRALALAPAETDSGDPVGRDAAWNRAIALRRIDEQDKKDAGNDASQDASADGSSPRDGGRDASRDAGGGKDAGTDASGGTPDSGAANDAGPQAPPPDAASEAPDVGAPPPASADQDERMLNQLENAPTLQQEEAKRFNKRRVRGMADK